MLEKFHKFKNYVNGTSTEEPNITVALLKDICKKSNLKKYNNIVKKNTLRLLKENKDKIASDADIKKILKIQENNLSTENISVNQDIEQFLQERNQTDLPPQDEIQDTISPTIPLNNDTAASALVPQDAHPSNPPEEATEIENERLDLSPTEGTDTHLETPQIERCRAVSSDAMLNLSLQLPEVVTPIRSSLQSELDATKLENLRLKNQNSELSFKLKLYDSMFKFYDQSKLLVENTTRECSSIIGDQNYSQQKIRISANNDILLSKQDIDFLKRKNSDGPRAFFLLQKIFKEDAINYSFTGNNNLKVIPKDIKVGIIKYVANLTPLNVDVSRVSKNFTTYLSKMRNDKKKEN